MAVVGLHGNVFKPHTGTKTSVLFVQKWDDELCPKREDYPIFFATMQEPSKDNSGDKIYEDTYFVAYHYQKETLEGCRRNIENKVQHFSYEEFIKKYKSLEAVEKYRDIISPDEIIDHSEYQKLPIHEKNRYRKVEYAVKYTDYKLDAHGHLIVKHDLYNHDGLTKDGIAEAFIEFAKKEKLSFFA